MRKFVGGQNTRPEFNSRRLFLALLRVSWLLPSPEQLYVFAHTTTPEESQISFISRQQCSTRICAATHNNVEKCDMKV